MDPSVVHLFQTVGGLWPFGIALAILAFIALGFGDVLSVIVHGFTHLGHFGLNFGTRVVFLAVACVFVLIFGFVLKNVAGAPSVTQYFQAVPAQANPGPAPAAPPAAPANQAQPAATGG